jgi:hypothetical protein
MGSCQNTETDEKKNVSAREPSGDIGDWGLIAGFSARNPENRVCLLLHPELPVSGGTYNSNQESSLVKRAGTAALTAVMVFILCAGLGGCSRRSGEVPTSRQGQLRQPADVLRMPGGEMPRWLDIYRSRQVVNVSTVDNVVIVTFETLGRRDEVFTHYAGEFGSEESFVSFRDNKDIISFLRDGYGVKITLLDSSRNLWSLEYHKEAI